MDEEDSILANVRVGISFEDNIKPFAQDVKKINPGQYLIRMADSLYFITVGYGAPHRRDQMRMASITMPPNTIVETWHTWDWHLYFRTRMNSKAGWMEIPPVYFPKPPDLKPPSRDKFGHILKNHANDGHIYFIVDEYSNMIKIGVSKNISARLKELQVSHHHNLTLIHSIPTNHMRKDEGRMHEKFKKYRIRGEWFSYDKEIRLWIEHNKC